MPTVLEYSAAADQAVESAELDPHAYQQIKDPRNLTLLLFFRNIKELIDREGSKLDKTNWALNAFKGLKAHPSRVYDVATLVKVKSCKAQVAGVVQDHLWSRHPPEPAGDDDLRFEQLQQEEALQEKARAKEANRKRKADAKAQEQLQCRQDIADGAGPDPLRDAAEAPAKKKQRVRKVYTPGFRTANYTFLCVLFKHQRLGLDYPMSKQQLMDAAEASGISRNPIHSKGGQVGVARPGAVQRFEYNGWSGFSDLKNKDPPYVVAYSNPVKIKLTPEGEILAAQFFKEMVKLGYTPDLPGSLAVADDTDSPSQPSANPQVGPSQPGPSSQAFRTATQPSYSPHSASQHRHTSASLASSHRPTGNTGRLHSQSSQDSPRASWHPSSSGYNASQPRGVGEGRAGVSYPAANPLLPNPSSCMRMAMGSHQPGSSSHSAAMHRGAGDSQVSRSAGTAAAAHNPLLPNPSACFQKAQTALQPSRQPAAAAQGPVNAHQGLVNASQGPVNAARPRAAGQPLAAKEEEDNPLVLQLVEIANCSYAKAKKAFEGGVTTVEEALDKFYLSSDPDGQPDIQEEDQQDGNDIAYASQPYDMLDDDDVTPYDIPIGASQSSGPAADIYTSAPTAKINSSLPPRLPTSSAVGGAMPASAVTGHAQASGKAVSRQQHVSLEVPSLSHQPSVGSLGRMDSHGSGTSRLGDPLGSQARQSSGQVQSAALESSRANWQLSPLGLPGQLEEQDIRVPPLPPGKSFSDCYELLMLIDSREKLHGNDRKNGLHTHLQAVRGRGVNVEIRTLQHGDVCWMARSRHNPAVEYVLDYLLERKSVEDLMGSIKNQRFDTQKYGMRRCGLRHLMYLVEGDPNNLQDSSIQAVKTAAHQTEVVGGYTVLRTDKNSDTLRCLGEWTNALNRKYAHLTANHPQVQNDGDFLPTYNEFAAATLENKSRTVQDVWGLVLTSLPGWSNIMAEAVVKQYGTPLLLYKAYEHTMKAAHGHSVEAARRLLMSCDLASNRRPISEANSAKVFDMLFGNGWHVV